MVISVYLYYTSVPSQVWCAGKYRMLFILVVDGLLVFVRCFECLRWFCPWRMCHRHPPNPTQLHQLFSTKIDKHSLLRPIQQSMQALRCSANQRLCLPSLLPSLPLPQTLGGQIREKEPPLQTFWDVMSQMGDCVWFCRELRSSLASPRQSSPFSEGAGE